MRGLQSRGCGSARKCSANWDALRRVRSLGCPRELREPDCEPTVFSGQRVYGSADMVTSSTGRLRMRVSRRLGVEAIIGLIRPRLRRASSPFCPHHVLACTSLQGQSPAGLRSEPEVRQSDAAAVLFFRGGPQGGNFAGDQAAAGGEFVDDGEGLGDALRCVDHDGEGWIPSAELEHAVAAGWVIPLSPICRAGVIDAAAPDRRTDLVMAQWMGCPSCRAPSELWIISSPVVHTVQLMRQRCPCLVGGEWLAFLAAGLSAFGCRCQRRSFPRPDR